jgi:2'-5' RNA ligase
MDSEGLYMLAIMPPEQLTREIEAIRIAFAEKYNCKAALKPPVHITLIPPYKMSAELVKQVAPLLRDFTRNQIPYPITIQDYDNFKGNEVVYMNVVHDDLLELFQQDLVTRIKRWLPEIQFRSAKGYHPHITIGYRDIPPEFFDAAAFAYKQKQFFATFIVDAIYLWKHSGLRWEIAERFPLGTMGGYATR